MWFHKIFGQIFHSNDHKCVEEKHFVDKLLSFERLKKIMLETFVSKSILYVYQNAKWKLIKTTSKIIQNVPKKKTFSCPKQSPS
jgi:hypothetical protein